ncbi:HD domain-containing protein [bacterium]|nr:HD domain-containing protein [bacterium]
MKETRTEKPQAGVENGLFEQIINDPQIQAFLALADEHLGVIGYTEHGARHGSRVAKWAGSILHDLGHSSEECSLARIAGYLHDIGNFICRENHGQTGATLLYPLLCKYPMTERQLGLVLSAVGNHEEQYGQVYNSICAAVMIGDKSDVHRSRVRDYDPSRNDIHDDVNYAVTRSQLLVDPNVHEIKLELQIDNNIASVMDYFEIFMERMVMCRNASQFLGCSFRISCNGTSIG